MGKGTRATGSPIELVLPYPPTTNRYYRHVGRRVLISAQGRAFLGIVGLAVRRAGSPRLGKARLVVEIELRPKNRRKHDVDNFQKAVLDGLERAEVFDNDCQIDDLRIYRTWPPEKKSERPSQDIAIVRIRKL